MTASPSAASARRGVTSAAERVFFARAEAYAGELFALRLDLDVSVQARKEAGSREEGSIEAFLSGPVPLRVRCRRVPERRLAAPSDWHVLTVRPDLSCSNDEHVWDEAGVEEFLAALGGVPNGCVAAAWVWRTGLFPPGWDPAEPTDAVRVRSLRSLRAAMLWASRWASGVDGFTVEDRASLLQAGVVPSEWDDWFAGQGCPPGRMAGRMRRVVEDLLGC